MADQRGEQAASGNPQRIRRRPRSVVIRMLNGLLICLGLTLGSGMLFAPEATERIYGATKIGVQELGRDGAAVAEEAITGERAHPQISLGLSGAAKELDRCDRTCTEMKPYEREGVPPVWAVPTAAAETSSFPWEIGAELQITGSPTVYRVVAIRYTSKVWSSTVDLVGLRGELALQTCVSGEDRMRLIGLEPVG